MMRQTMTWIFRGLCWAHLLSAILLLSFLSLNAGEGGTELFKELKNNLENKQYRQATYNLKRLLDTIETIHKEKIRELLPKTPEGWSFLGEDWHFGLHLSTTFTYQRGNDEKVYLRLIEGSDEKEQREWEWKLKHPDELSETEELVSIQDRQGIVVYFEEYKETKLQLPLKKNTAILKITGFNTQKSTIIDTFASPLDLNKIESILYTEEDFDRGADLAALTHMAQEEFDRENLGKSHVIVIHLAWKTGRKRAGLIRSCLPEEIDGWKRTWRWTHEAAAESYLFRLSQEYEKEGKYKLHAGISIYEEPGSKRIEDVKKKLAASDNLESHEEVVTVGGRKAILEFKPYGSRYKEGSMQLLLLENAVLVEMSGVAITKNDLIHVFGKSIDFDSLEKALRQ